MLLGLETKDGGIEAGHLGDPARLLLERRAEMDQHLGLAAQSRPPGSRIGPRGGSSLLPAAPLASASFVLACHGDLP